MNRASFLRFFTVAKALLNFYPYILCEVNSTLVCVNYLCLSPSEKHFLDYIIWCDQIWSIYFQRFDLLVRYFSNSKYFLSHQKWLILQNFSKTRKNSNEWKLHLLMNSITWVLLQSYRTLQNIIIYFGIISFYEQPKK